MTDADVVAQQLAMFESLIDQMTDDALDAFIAFLQEKREARRAS